MLTGRVDGEGSGSGDQAVGCSLSLHTFPCCLFHPYDLFEWACLLTSYCSLTSWISNMTWVDVHLPSQTAWGTSQCCHSVTQGDWSVSLDLQLFICHVKKNTGDVSITTAFYNLYFLLFKICAFQFLPCICYLLLKEFKRVLVCFFWIKVIFDCVFNKRRQNN